MTLDEVRKFFGGYRKAMRQCHYCDTTYLHWRKQGSIPYHAQVRISAVSKGMLHVDEDCVNKYKESKDGYRPIQAERNKQNAIRDD